MTHTSLKSYKDLDIYQIAFKLAIKIYTNSLEPPSHDKFEVGSQIRRSSQGIKDAIVEGYGRKRYKADFIKFLTYSHASLLEATSQAEFLEEVHPGEGWKSIANELNELGIKIFHFLQYVEENWRS
jgi:four helix bundle protein